MTDYSNRFFVTECYDNLSDAWITYKVRDRANRNNEIDCYKLSDAIMLLGVLQHYEHTFNEVPHSWPWLLSPKFTVNENLFLLKQETRFAMASDTMTYLLMAIIGCPEHRDVYYKQLLKLAQEVCSLDYLCSEKAETLMLKHTRLLKEALVEYALS